MPGHRRSMRQYRANAGLRLKEIDIFSFNYNLESVIIKLRMGIWH